MTIPIFYEKKFKKKSIFILNKEMVNIDNLYVFCISLNERDDRRERINKNFDFFNIIFFEAIDTRKEKWKKYKDLIEGKSYQKLIVNTEKNTREYHHDLTSGAVGCFLSHLNIYQYIVNHNLDYSFILEDDTKPTIYNYKQYLRHVFKYIPEDADVVLLHYILPQVNKYNIISVNTALSKVQPNKFQFWCLDSYIITKKGAKKILDNFNKITMQIDSFLTKLHREGKINIYITNKQYTTQSDNKTDIQTLRRVLYPSNFNF